MVDPRQAFERNESLSSFTTRGREQRKNLNNTKSCEGIAFAQHSGNIHMRRTAFFPQSRCLLHNPTPSRTRPKRFRHRPVACDTSTAAGNGKPSPEESGPAPSSSEEPVFEPSTINPEEYFAQLQAITEAETALSNPLGLKKSFEIVEIDEDGFGPRDRYVYVEERDCIGCTHCATTASGTFFMESEWGRARVFDQTGDTEGDVEVAIDTCPVNCIYYVDWNDLVALENMREDQVINNKSRLVGGSDISSSRKGKTKTNVMDSGIMRCEDCPGRGCSDCPLFGVGENPEYLRKKKMRETRKKNRNLKRASKRKLL